MADLLTNDVPDRDEPGEPLGLQVELLPVTPTAGRRLGTGPVPAVRVGLRPVVRGRKGGWIRTGVSWDKISAHQLRQLGPRADHLRLLREIHLLHSLSITARYFSYDINYLYLDGIGSRRIWDLLAEARSAGIEIVQSGQGQPAVTVSDGRAEIVLEDRPGGRSDLLITPFVAVGGSWSVPSSSRYWSIRCTALPTGRRLRNINSSALILVPSVSRFPPSCGFSWPVAPSASPRQDGQSFVRTIYPGSPGGCRCCLRPAPPHFWRSIRRHCR